MTAGLTVGRVAEWSGGRLLQGDPAISVAGVAWDTRQLTPGQCFVALKGAAADGHDYVAAAFAAGAACALVQRPVAAPAGAPLIQADDPVLALGQLAAAYRAQFPARVVGVTGSVGKTTTKDMCYAAISAALRTLRSPGNLNTEVGLPAVLLNQLTAETEAVVLEMGMRGLGQIAYLASIARPQVAVITNVGTSHLELLGSVENIARAKGELVEALGPDGTAVLNASDPLVTGMAARCAGRVIFYGLDAAEVARAAAARPGARTVTLEGLRSRGEAGQEFTLVLDGSDRAQVLLPALGPHMALNALAAAAAGWALGIPAADLARGLGGYTPSGNRMRMIQQAGLRIIDDTYNAAPVSMAAALETLDQLAAGRRRVAVLGDMYELGPAAETSHRTVGGLAARRADLLIAVGDLARYYVEAARQAGLPPDRAQYFTNRNEAVAFLFSTVRAGDTILFKGSRGMHMEELVAALERRIGGTSV